MRALAILAVVLYHSQVPGFGGGFVGVDFFFVLSGYLIMGLLVREYELSGGVDLAAFWARRSRRLIPASAVVIMVTALVSGAVLPFLDRTPVAIDGLWATAFSANWRFIQQQTDYLAQARDLSPFLHYWSLGVEEQFYVLWPIVLGVICVVVRARQRRALGSAMPTASRLSLYVGVVLGVVVAASFVWNVREVVVNQPAAFLGTFSRIWQLGLGALLALGARHVLRVSRPARAWLGLLGLAGFVVSVVTLRDSGSGSHAYPGWWALVPTVAACALIVAGAADDSLPVTRWLSRPSLGWVGDRSYSWYLWHWPVLILGLAILDKDSTFIRLVLVAGSLVLAALSYQFLERPIRRARTLVLSPKRSLLMGGAFLAVAALCCGYVVEQTRSAPAPTVVDSAGQTVAITPDPAKAASDVFSMRRLGCDLDVAEVTPPTCQFGDVVSDQHVVLLGDSHAVALFPGIEAVAQDNHWSVNSWTKSGCPMADVVKWDKARERIFAECATFREIILDRVLAMKPSQVIMANAVDPTLVLVDPATGDHVTGDQAKDMYTAGLRETVKRLTDAGIKVTVVRDFPWTPFNVADCLIEKSDVDACTFPRPVAPYVEKDAVDGLEGAQVLDLVDHVCTATTCVPVQGNVLVYRDRSHITKTFALTLQQDFGTILTPP